MAQTSGTLETDSFSDGAMPLSRPPGPLPLPPPVRRTRWLVGSLLGLVIAGVVGLTYLRIERELEATLRDKLSAILSANVNSAEEWLADQETLARALAEQPEMRAAALQALRLREQPEAVQTALHRAAHPLVATQVVAELHIFDHRGQPILAHTSAAPHAPLPTEVLTRLRDRGSEVLISGRLPGATWNGQVAALAPIVQDGRVEAVLCLLINGEGLARRLHVVSWGASGETFAFDEAGAFLASARFEKALHPSVATSAGTTELARKVDAKGSNRAAAEGRARMAERARRKTSGVDVIGYRGDLGREVVGAWHWLPSYRIGVATEISRDEAYQSVSILRGAFITLSTLVGLALLGFVMLGRWTLRVRQESALVTARLGRLARTIQPLSAALEHDPSAVLLVDSSGHVVYANAASHGVLDIHQPLVGQTVERAFQGLAHELRAALDSGQDSIVARGPEEEGETLLVSSRGLRIDGRQHYLYMLRPVTQQVRRQEIENLRKLIRVLSHELNNSMAPIISLVSSARKLNERGANDERLTRIFDAVSERASHLTAFLKRYGAVARLPHPSPRLVNWRTFINGLACQGTFHLRGELPSRPGFFDPIQVERVLLNLVANAREAGSPPEDVELRVTEEEDSVTIEVQDRGSGMPEKVLHQAMLPFFSTKESGTGIGLALSREIIEGHGGNIVLANREGGGLTVSCTLPRNPYDQSRGSLSQLRVSLLAGSVRSTETAAEVQDSTDGEAASGTIPSDGSASEGLA